jgi:hypothetical protein
LRYYHAVRGSSRLTQALGSGMKFFSRLLVILLPINASHATNLCDILDHAEDFQEKSIRIAVQAVAAQHQFDIALTDPSCPSRNIFLSAGQQFGKNPEFMRLMKTLYPGYPHDDRSTNAHFRVIVTGKLFRQRNRGLLMTYLELENIERA